MIKITKIERLGEHRLRVWFNDGAVGDHDFAELRREIGPMIEPLHDPAYFARVFLEDGALIWPNGFDAAPGWLYREMKARGEFKAAATA